MKLLEQLDKKQIIILTGVIIFIVSIIVYYFYTMYQDMKEDSQEISSEEVEVLKMEDNEESNKTNEIIIHISGAVKKEGIIRIKEGARISDVIEAAGGLQEEASLKNVNLAYMVEDGQKIYIPTKEEEQQEDEEYRIVQEGNTSSSDTKKGEYGKVNINKATQSELEELSGIGASMALKIIQYREENGKFHSIEDIKNVSGIGEAKYNNIKDNITI